ncbi:UNVERIFIED_CONTAM: hypothetical protein GTU68_029149 [Idotea baltica]|nr:hypothetical protein [Idotea baltica]
MTSTTINTMLGGEIFFKCENFQKIGAFKIRGALNVLLQMDPSDLKHGVCTHSSGNHAQAVALGAKMLDLPAIIVMPSNAPVVKQAAVKGYGAQIRLCEPTLAARESTVEEVIAETGARFIHPYDDYGIITGQATCALELLEEVPDLDLVMAPVGGGGLLAGTALSVHYFHPNAKVIAGEPRGADDAYRSFKDKTLHPSESPDTIADGLLTSLGKKNFPILLEHVSEILLASEDQIRDAMRLIWERMKIIIEPSCAVPLAALIENNYDVKGKRVGIIITGGNVDLGKLPF